MPRHDFDGRGNAYDFDYEAVKQRNDDEEKRLLRRFSASRHIAERREQISAEK